MYNYIKFVIYYNYYIKFVLIFEKLFVNIRRETVDLFQKCIDFTRADEVKEQGVYQEPEGS